MLGHGCATYVFIPYQLGTQVFTMSPQLGIEVEKRKKWIFYMPEYKKQHDTSNYEYSGSFTDQQTSLPQICHQCIKASILCAWSSLTENTSSYQTTKVGSTKPIEYFDE